MKVLLYFLVLSVAASARADIAGECNMAGFYLELGCSPVSTTPTTTGAAKESGTPETAGASGTPGASATPEAPADNSTVCPDAFVCPDLHPDPSMCYYRGAPYSDRNMIPQGLINNPCSQACGCNVGASRFECAAVDCVETFDRDVTTQCIRTYELDSCCSVGTVCGKDAIAKLSICEIDGVTYRQGETFQPKNTRKTCICTPQWNGSLENPDSCRDINCGIEIHYQGEILKNCAPIFVGDARSCPITFQCPTNSTKVIRGLNVRAVSSQCLFGNTTLSVGDEVITDEQCTKCTCDVPPFVSCTKANSC